MSLSVQQRHMGTLQPGDLVVVIRALSFLNFWALANVERPDDFDARGSDELTLRKSDQIELLELDEGFGDGWYLGRLLDQGTTGLFPGVYTAKLPRNFTPVGGPSIKPQQLGADPRGVKQPASTGSDNDGTAHHMVTTSQSPNLLSRTSVPPPPSSYIPGIQRSIGQALSGTNSGEDSPVMNETLSVIDEHITDLSTPRQSLAPPQPMLEDSESDYGSHMDRASYIAGPETDSEDNSRLTETEVKQWDAKETAEYLRSIGVDPKHCDIFEEQEISGDVLLEMDQSFIHMKDYDFGLMGRRLKTWHKIRDFQNQVRGAKDSRKSSLRQTSSTEEVPRLHSRALSGNTILPRIPSLMEERGLSIRQSQQPQPYIHIAGASTEQPLSPTSFARSQLGSHTPPSPWRSSMVSDSPTRPSAASIREMNHSRRHSSIDFAKNGLTDPVPGSPRPAISHPHKKMASLDRDWSMSNATTANAGESTPSLKISTVPDGVDLATTPPFLGEGSAIDLDRGYFSGNEVENRKTRNLLRKREGTESAGHSRQSSALEGKTNQNMKRHSRLSSVDSVVKPPMASQAAKAYHSSSYRGRFRSASARNLTVQRSPVVQSPTVTNLEDESLSNLSSPKGLGTATSPAVATTTHFTTSQKARKLLGLRAASEAVTGSEKEAAISPNTSSEPLKDSPLASPSGSQTPSATSRSFDLDNTDASSKGTTEQLGPLLHTKTAMRPNPKTKRQTSAYTKGLLQISPAEARQHCDYSGWMKKRSTGLIAQWKPRLFILRGRRLSYYYSEDDAGEMGIIDISGHKVLVVNSDPISTLQATISAATPSMGTAASPTEKSPDVSRGSGGGTPFFFKLVPPKAGLSRAVQFTKPAVHVFQADNISEGRKWMGEILKATIEHDLSSFETTNRQKTISLAKARARKERPPALKGTDEAQEEEEVSELAERPTPLTEKDFNEAGLNIQGLNFSESRINLSLRGDPLNVTKSSHEGDGGSANT
ncbi:polar growth protein [Exophiala xenobiotica]|nr:polar growth protein [Exophiala xenobiotica]KAK5250912.1 polar growth protein [Exophiala xenobiotica]KAK5356435.1 polar growth protein [Exophiala xenobiotica]KAK5370904.1 polar growth protein [Exophiala xenobiotica]KAK5389744.1 polar growth protein [Exophiala xenobiotica]